MTTGRLSLFLSNPANCAPRVAHTRLFRPLEELHGRFKMENTIRGAPFTARWLRPVTVGGRGSITVNGAVSRIAFEKSVANVHCARYAK